MNLEQEARVMKIYALQYAIAWEDKERNQQQIEAQLEQIKPEACALVVLPELSCIGFTMRREGLAEDPGQATQEFYARLARKFSVTLIGGCSWWGPQGLGRNMALVLEAHGKMVGSYCKQHPFSFAGETEHYASGDEVLTFQWEGVKVAPLICYDLRFPESFRQLVMQGVEFFVVIANWPSARVHHWESLLLARAIENQAYVLGVNRCGQDPKVSYPGSTRLIDPQGQVVQCLDDQPGVLQADLDMEELRAYRARFPALSDIRRLPAL